MKVIDLQCEAMHDPIGISTISPRLSWKLTSEQRDITQESYRVCINRVQEDGNGCSEFFASEWKESADTEIILPEIFTESSARYVWSVQVKNNKGENVTSGKAYFETGLLYGKDWKTLWAEPIQKEIKEDHHVPTANEPNQSHEIDESALTPTIMLRKNFNVSRNIARARAYITSHGIYRMEVNGNRVGSEEFMPEATQYDQYLQVQTYDITGLLIPGTNAVGAVLSDGWWSGRIGHYGDPVQFGNKKALLLQIIVWYQNGQVEVIGTEEMKSSTEGPRRYGELYIGEKYDSKKEINGWSQADFDSSSWSSVPQVDYGTEALVGQNAQPIRVLEVVENVKLYRSPKNEEIIDFGQVMAGNAFMHLSGKPGATVKLEYFEETDSDGNYWFELAGRNSQQIDTYILNDDGEGDYDPWFTYHGFRYIRVSSDKGEVITSNEKARLIGSSVDVTATFHASDEKLNKLFQNYMWTFRSNIMSIVTDNPDRERAGWTGDLQMVGPAMMYFMDMQAFSRRWLREAGLQQDDCGDIPQVIPSWKLYRQIQEDNHMPTSAGWGDVLTILPWTLYERYGDVRILEQNYEIMKKWTEHEAERARSANPSGLIPSSEKEEENLKYIWNADFNYGDWLTPSACFDPKTGTYTYFTQTLTYLMGTYYYAWSVSIMARAAMVLGYKEDAGKFNSLLKKIRSAAIEEIYRKGGILESEFPGACALALHMGFYPEEERGKVVKRLIELCDKKGMDFGFSSALVIFDILCQNGYQEKAYEFLLDDRFPSCIYEINQGATSVWESMQAVMPNGDRNAVSFIQPGYCSTGNWIMQGIGGIHADAAGFKKIRIQPYLSERLKNCSAEYESVKGMIRSCWEIKDKMSHIKVEIPAGTTAVVVLPGAEPDKVMESAEKLNESIDGIHNIQKTSQGIEVTIGSGYYDFSF